MGACGPTSGSFEGRVPGWRVAHSAQMRTGRGREGEGEGEGEACGKSQAQQFGPLNSYPLNSTLAP